MGLLEESEMIVNSDYPLDKIIYMTSGSFVVGANSSFDLAIPHGLPFTPLMDGSYSTDPTFSLAYDIGSGVPTTSPIGLFEVSTTLNADPTDVNFQTINFTGSSKTIYYRFFGFMPTNSYSELAPVTASVAEDFVINTEYNYTKLYDAGIVTSDTTVNIGIGHRVQVVTWVELLDGTITLREYNELNNTFTDMVTKVTNDDVQFIFFSGTPIVHYRIYLDR